MYKSYMFTGLHSLANFLRVQGQNHGIDAFTWTTQKKLLLIVPICQHIVSWVQSDKEEVRASTRSNRVTTAKIFLDFLSSHAAKSGLVPAVGRDIYLKFLQWEKQLALTLSRLAELGLNAYKAREMEASVNRKVGDALDSETMRNEMEAVRAVPNHPAFKRIMDSIAPVSIDSPSISQFSTEMFDNTCGLLAVLLLGCSGHRVQVLDIISLKDVDWTGLNTKDKELFTMSLEEFEYQKSGKTREDIYIFIYLAK